MMTGYVNSRLEAIIQFAVLGENERLQGIKGEHPTFYLA
jgi:hypothetical protein